MHRRRLGHLAGWFVGLAVMGGCAGSGTGTTPVAQDTVAVTWVSALLQAIRTVKPGPTVTARSIAIVNTAMYDAWAAYDPKAVGTRLGGTFRRPAAEWTNANKDKAVSYAAYRALVDQFPTEKANFDTLMNSMGLDPANASTDAATPEGVGNVAAKALLDFRHADGSNQLGDLHAGAYTDYTGYAPVNTVDTIVDPNHWQPLKFSTGATPGFTTPHWGRVVGFSITDPTALRPEAPPVAGSAEYKEAADEIVSLEANLTDKEKVIAEYWADGPKSEFPPGHWQLFGQYVSRRDRHDLDQDVKMFFMLGNAVLDSSICCWEAKRFYDYARPITAIRYLYKDQTIKGWLGPGKGIGDIQGQNWVPYQPSTFITPPFAEYTSGHSTFSASCAEVLKRFTGSDYFGNSVTFATGASLTEPGVTPTVPVTLSWQTFSDAADEAGMSRRYGGIHFKSGDLKARAMGRVIGGMVYDKAMDYINGRAP